MRRSRVLLLLIACCVLFGCAGNGYAPVDYRGERGSGATSGKPPAAGTHRVRSGDTLYSIAFQHNLRYQAVAAWNGIHSPYLIRVGQVLRLNPPGRTKGQKAPVQRKGPTRTDASKPAQASTKPKPRARARKTGSVTWFWPTAGRVSKTFSRRGGGKKGVGIRGRAGQAVKAAAGGRVVYAGSGVVGYGKLLIVKHNATYLSAYGHNNKLLVQEGARVPQGQVIAEMGSTGAKSPMLHFEIRKHGKPVDPLRYLPKR